MRKWRKEVREENISKYEWEIKIRESYCVDKVMQGNRKKEQYKYRAIMCNDMKGLLKLELSCMLWEGEKERVGIVNEEMQIKRGRKLCACEKWK